MIRVRQVKINIKDNNLKKKIASILRIREGDIIDYSIIKESIDSRYKPDIYYVYELDVNIKDESKIRFNKDIFISPKEEYKYAPKGDNKLNNRIVVVGSGPGGLFTAYMLSMYGYKPIIIERGKKVEERLDEVNKFLETGVLNTECNVQFGEGGAGTFSDGKLNTMIKDKYYRGKKVFEIFVECGAPKEIIYKNKPHIGTDLLCNVIKNMRNKIISMGGEFLYNTKLTDLVIKDNKLEEIIVNDNKHIKCNVLVLAIGHSARDTFYMLNNYLKMESKPFAVGIRIEHKQEMISKNQYGDNYKELEPASYKLTYTTKEGRGVYTFCMCPGGYVINSSSEKDMLCINGMSEHKRDSENANSAVIVTVSNKDYGNNTLDGIEYQRNLEKAAYKLGNGNIPIQLYKDFKDNNKSNNIGNINPLFKGNYTLSNLRDILPNYLSNSLVEGIEAFDKKIRGFACDDAIIAGIESRTSSPVRIIRDAEGVSSVSGIYPCGEGAGYAGGITSSAIDGIITAENIMNKYHK
jgi:uncharacterized FAD-dependent dehydrogenase